MIRTKDETVAEIIRLEIEASKIVHQAGGSIYGSNLFPKYLKLTRKIQKLRDSL
jgi:hypothetical protein